jgi:hypothetical protein
MPHIRHSIEIVAPVDRVYTLVSLGPGFLQWWAADVTSVGPREVVELAFFKSATVYRLRPIRMARPRPAEWLCESVTTIFAF